MRCARIDKKPTWWLVYTIGLLLPGLLTLIEIFIPAGGLRGVLQIAVVIVIFGLMAIWMRCNRVAIELEERNGLHRPQNMKARR